MAIGANLAVALRRVGSRLDTWNIQCFAVLNAVIFLLVPLPRIRQINVPEHGAAIRSLLIREIGIRLLLDILRVIQGDTNDCL